LLVVYNSDWLNFVEQNQNGNTIDKNEVDYIKLLDLFSYTSESTAYGKNLGKGIPNLLCGTATNLDGMANKPVTRKFKMEPLVL
jgi:hypothetical protein